MTGKQRAYLKSLASTSDTILQVGKEGLTPECTASIAEALAARELVKIGILQNYDGDLEELARTAAERTRSQLIQVIGRKFVLYKEGRDEKKRIILPPAGKKS
ncbi:MAG: YhbY family RNA-binding protein [Lachnospiraceae bacterium]|jgi:RNA-binding protein|uniref:YhbY family RNA-binding protein n=1 Tax=Porcincola sp. LCP21S3_C12 TaxID=3438798 RepID=UPI00297976C4|nr:YhbY family RNA-binding protein [Lachnospiraceae bacterium]